MSTRNRTRYLRFACWACARTVWAAMLAAHGVWLVRSFGSPDAWMGQQLALGLTVAFFALKTLDARALRLRISRRGLVACVVIVALLHAGAIERWSGEDTTSVLWMLPVLVFVPFCLRRGILAIIRRVLLRVAAIGHVPLAWTHRFWKKYAGVLIRRHQQLLIALATPRAPPV